MRIERVFIDPAVRNRSNVRELLARLPPATAIFEESKPRLAFSESKRTLFLTEQKSGFVQKCPGIFQTVCCNYYVINWISNCAYDCSYCFLQGYLVHNPLYEIYMNDDRLFQELDAHLSDSRFARIGSGELSDSLLLDPITHHSRKLVRYFRNKPQVFLELKTKSTEVDLLLEDEACPNVIPSWSLNSETIWKTEEAGTPSMAERLDAAARVASHGYAVGFHFDPVVFYPEWETGYLDTIQRLFKAVSADRIAWISIGLLRLFPEMKRQIYRRFPHTSIFASEFITTEDGKIRYFTELRKNMVRFMMGEIESRGPDIPVYVCMETPSFWEELEAGRDGIKKKRGLDQCFRDRMAQIARAQKKL